jgi:hypothetical protein
LERPTRNDGQRRLPAPRCRASATACASSARRRRGYGAARRTTCSPSPSRAHDAGGLIERPDPKPSQRERVIARGQDPEDPEWRGIVQADEQSYRRRLSWTWRLTALGRSTIDPEGELASEASIIRMYG